ncbi:MAG: hypothetical protein IKL10_04820 [Clostridia bacterium]|nr:hypothetical protein [Clostridia bacterium]
MATCRECKNYDECNKNKKIKIEVVPGEPVAKLCNYVEQICRRYTPQKEG